MKSGLGSFIPAPHTIERLLFYLFPYLLVPFILFSTPFFSSLPSPTPFYTFSISSSAAPSSPLLPPSFLTPPPTCLHTFYLFISLFHVLRLPPLLLCPAFASYLIFPSSSLCFPLFSPPPLLHPTPLLPPPLLFHPFLVFSPPPFTLTFHPIRHSGLLLASCCSVGSLTMRRTEVHLACGTQAWCQGCRGRMAFVPAHSCHQAGSLGAEERQGLSRLCPVDTPD